MTRRTNLKPCGTPAAYRRHLRDGTTPCKACLEAEAARQRKNPRPPQPMPCGTRAAYSRHLAHGERACEACLAANAVRAREDRRRKRERAAATQP